MSGMFRCARPKDVWGCACQVLVLVFFPGRVELRAVGAGDDPGPLLLPVTWEEPRVCGLLGIVNQDSAIMVFDDCARKVCRPDLADFFPRNAKCQGRRVGQLTSWTHASSALELLEFPLDPFLVTLLSCHVSRSLRYGM